MCYGLNMITEISPDGRSFLCTEVVASRGQIILSVVQRGGSMSETRTHWQPGIGEVGRINPLKLSCNTTRKRIEWSGVEL